MRRFDPNVRIRVLRVLLAVLGIMLVSLLIGLSAGHPLSLLGVAEGQATEATEPIATPGPTASATPRPTLTPTPAPTPNGLSATLAPADGWLLHSLETFERASTWPAGEQPGWASGYENGRYWLKLTGQRTISYRIPLDTLEFRITVDVQVKGGDAGLLFLSGDSNGVYRFLVDNAGRYRLERQQGGESTALKDWTAATALKLGADAVNQIEVRRVENEITLFANGTKLTTYALPASAKLQAQVGMTLDAVARDTVAMAYFDNLVVRVPVVPAP